MKLVRLKKEHWAVEKDIKSFNTLGASIFEAFQPSGMGTPIYHMLDHVCVDFKKLVSSQVVGARLYEYLHNVL